MSKLLHELVRCARNNDPEKHAIVHQQTAVPYQLLDELVNDGASAFATFGLEPNDRVAIFLPKQLETVVSMLAVSAAGGVFVPVNPVLKAPQVTHILADCNVRILVTSADRFKGLQELLPQCPDLERVILTKSNTAIGNDVEVAVESIEWETFVQQGDANKAALPTRIDGDMAAILYTSGSTGKPKGVVISHRNLVAGAESVAKYLNMTSTDKLLAVLPFSFDYGLNQLISSLLMGATCVLLDYLLPKDVLTALAKHEITGLAAVPPLWAQLARLEWPNSISGHLRYMTNTGGKMPLNILNEIRTKSPASQFYLMYGLTEAFRSTYLPPEEIERRPNSIGKAIPNAEIMVIGQDGKPCKPHEPGELVHRGVHVAMGYWNDPDKTAARFKPAPQQLTELPLPDMCVWSGDTVEMDDEGYLYFVGRQDDMIKTSGYRVSPTEVEEIAFASGVVTEAVALGLPHADLGELIVLVTKSNGEPDSDIKLRRYCKQQMPNYMVPREILWVDDLPRTPNGKMDRNKIRSDMQTMFDK